MCASTATPPAPLTSRDDLPVVDVVVADDVRRPVVQQLGERLVAVHHGAGGDEGVGEVRATDRRPVRHLGEHAVPGDRIARRGQPPGDLHGAWDAVVAVEGELRRQVGVVGVAPVRQQVERDVARDAGHLDPWDQTDAGLAQRPPVPPAGRRTCRGR